MPLYPKLHWIAERAKGGRIKTEVDVLDSNPPKAMAKTLEAIRTLESMVLNARDVAGIVLRYGSFYGPGASLSPDGEIPKMVRRYKLSSSTTVPASDRSLT